MSSFFFFERLEETDEVKRPSFIPCPTDFKEAIGAIANIGVQFNVHVISEALFILKDDRPLEDWMKSLIESAVFAGAVVGMMVMGYLGDTLGRDRAMVVTMILLAFGSAGSSVLTWGSGNSLYYVMAAFRFLLGIGSGGVYPLYAAKAVEEGGDLDHVGKSIKSAKGFFWRLPGAMLVFILALILFISQLSHELQWRILLGLGVIFPVINIIEIILVPRKMNMEFEAAKHRRNQSVFSLVCTKNNFQNLVVTGGCWFLYDAVYYGTTLVQPEIVDKLWPDDSFESNCLHSVIPLICALPVATFAIYILRTFGTRLLQIWGFIAVSTFYFALSILDYLNPSSISSVYVIYILLYSSFWLPNISTYVLCAETYSPEVRGTMTGISAALGKLGAISGNWVFTALFHSEGLRLCMGGCAIISFLGAVISCALMESEEVRLHRNINIRRQTSSFRETFVSSVPEITSYISVPDEGMLIRRSENILKGEFDNISKPSRGSSFCSRSC